MKGEGEKVGNGERVSTLMLPQSSEIVVMAPASEHLSVGFIKVFL